MTSMFEQPMVKLLRILSPTITWLETKGSIEVADVPTDHLEAIKQLERIGVVHKRNNRCYELQRIRLKKLMGSMGINTLTPIEPTPSPTVTQVAPTIELPEAQAPVSVNSELN